VECFHAFLGASVVAPGHTQVLPLPPEFIAPQDGAEKQDCERNAAKRWLVRHGRAVAHLRPVYLGDDLFACQPIAAAIQDTGGNFILTCKPSSHQTITEYLQGATPDTCRARRRIPAGRDAGRASPDRVQTRQAHHHHLPVAFRRAAARHRRCHPGQLVLHRDP
jgi:hypothetical protein